MSEDQQAQAQFVPDEGFGTAVQRQATPARTMPDLPAHAPADHAPPLPAPERANRDAARFTPEQAARALHRALAVAHERHDDRAIEMSLDELMALGREIGIDPDDIRVAAALEGVARRTEPDNWLERLVGPAVASSQHVVTVRAERAQELLEEWVRIGHCMRLRDRGTNWARWEPTGGIAGAVRRGLRSAAGEPVDEDLTGMTTRVAPLDASRSVVALEIEPGPRGRTVAAVVGASALAGLAGAGLGAFLTPFALLAIPAGLVISAGIILARRRRVAAAERAIGRIMSGVAGGERPPTTLDALRGRLGR